MSDHNGENPVERGVEAGSHAIEPGATQHPVADDLPAGDPALASRLETIHRTMSTLGMRLDALVTSTTSYRAALTDRLTEYADLVTKLTRTQANDLEEYRRTNERILADLRRGLATSEETLERVGARIDSMLTDTESSDDAARRMLAEVRGILDAQESLGRFLTDSLDQFAEQVTGRLEAADRDAVARLEAMQQAFRDIDPTGALDGRLGSIEERLTAISSSDPAAALAGRFETLHVALDDLAHRIGTQLAEHASAAPAVDLTPIGSQLDRLEHELTSSGQVATESWGELANLRSKIDAVLQATSGEAGSVTRVLDEIREALLDVASGEVVGTLWDEFRQVRASVQQLVDQSGQTADPAAVEALRTDVESLAAAVRDLLEQAEVVEEPAASGPPAEIIALAADVSALRRELAAGLVVEPSDDFGASVGDLRRDVAAIDERLGEMGDLRAAIADVRDAVDAVAAQPAPPAPAPAPAPSVEVDLAPVEEHLRTLRSGIEDIIGRLDEGLVLAEELPAAPASSPAVDAEIADQLATLRDMVATEFDAVRHLLDGTGGTASAPAADTGEIAAALGDIQDALAHLLDRPTGGAVDLTGITNSLAQLENDVTALTEQTASASVAPAGAAATGGYAELDPDVVDLLREEIRNAGSASDELVEALRGELKSLRRRIKLRAEGEIFSADDLDAIAEAVARKLGS